MRSLLFCFIKRKSMEKKYILFFMLLLSLLLLAASLSFLFLFIVPSLGMEYGMCNVTILKSEISEDYSIIHYKLCYKEICKNYKTSNHITEEEHQCFFNPDNIQKTLTTKEPENGEPIIITCIFFFLGLLSLCNLISLIYEERKRKQLLNKIEFI